MLTRRTLALGVLALSAWLAGWQAARAEPTDPAPQPAQDRYGQAQDLEKQGQIKEAIAAYEEAIRLGMQLFPRVHLKEAGAYLKLKDYDAAIAKYTKFIDDFGLESSCRT